MRIGTGAALYELGRKADARDADLVFNFYKVYAILDEVFLAGEIQETSRPVVLERLRLLYAQE